VRLHLVLNAALTTAASLAPFAAPAQARAAAAPHAGGNWFSPYDDATVRDAVGLDADRIVPLAEARDSGASMRSPAERERYANDLGHLIAVTAHSHRPLPAPTNRSRSNSPADPGADVRLYRGLRGG
jgi:hypothetical protein